MSVMSFKQLDERINQKKTSDLITLNLLGEQGIIQKRATLHTFIMLIFSGVLVLISTLLGFTGTERDYIQLLLGTGTCILLIVAYFRGTKMALMSIAVSLIAYGLYNLIILTIINGSVQLSSVLVGGFQILIALTYLREAKRFEDLSNNIPTAIDASLYQDVYDTLKTQAPNNSNMLIELRHSKQAIIVWLRPTSVVMLFKRDKRVYFDVHHVFKLTASDQDQGGNLLPVNAHIIDRSMTCYISRHAWLRYTQFTN